MTLWTRIETLCTVLLLSVPALGAGYYQTITNELADSGLAAPVFVYGETESAVFDAFRSYGAAMADADVTADTLHDHQYPFDLATTYTIKAVPANHWHMIFGTRASEQIVSAGDILYVQFYVRGDRADTELPIVSVAVKNQSGGTLFSERLGVPPEWTRFGFAFEADETVAAGELKTEFFFGYAVQEIHVGGIAVAHYRQDQATVDRFPRNRYDYTYGGREAGAAWRAEARQRIDTYRKGTLSVRVVDHSGAPVTGSTVTISQQSHAFRFGNLLANQWILEDWESAETFRDTFLTYFNEAISGTIKWSAWIGKWGPNNDSTQTLQAIDWARQNGLSVHLHTVCWHDHQHMPLDYESLTDNQIRTAILDHVRRMMGHPSLTGRGLDWDVINHPIGFTKVWQQVGKDIMLEELRTARRADSSARIFVNEGGVIAGGGYRMAAHQDMIDYYLTNDAPLDGLGFMCHFSAGALTSIPRLWERVDRFVSLGRSYEKELAAKVTEFDLLIDTTSAHQRELQYDYTRDFLTAMFAHPAVVGINSWGFWEKRIWRPAAAWWSTQWEPWSCARAFRELVREEWWTDTTAVTGRNGTVSQRVCRGEYVVRVGDDSIVVEVDTAGTGLRYNGTEFTREDPVATHPGAPLPAVPRPDIESTEWFTIHGRRLLPAAVHDRRYRSAVLVSPPGRKRLLMR